MGRCPYAAECWDALPQRPLAIRNAQLLQGIEPLHNVLGIALVSLRTNKAIVEGVLACELPCGGTR